MGNANRARGILDKVRASHLNHLHVIIYTRFALESGLHREEVRALHLKAACTKDEVPLCLSQEPMMPAFGREQRNVLLVVHWLQLEKISAVVAHAISRMAARALSHTHTLHCTDTL